MSEIHFSEITDAVKRLCLEANYVMGDDGFGDPTKPRTLRKAWHAAIRRAGVPDISFHSARNTTATLLRRAGLSIEEVAQTLRHFDPATTLRTYSAVPPDRRGAAAEMRERVLSGS